MFKIISDVRPDPDPDSYRERDWIYLIFKFIKIDNQLHNPLKEYDNNIYGVQPHFPFELHITGGYHG